MSYWLLGEEEGGTSNFQHRTMNIEVEEVFTEKAGEELLIIGDWLLGEEEEEESWVLKSKVEGWRV